MNVWILFHVVPYEGSAVMGVYASAEAVEDARYALLPIPAEKDRQHTIVKFEVLK